MALLVLFDAAEVEMTTSLPSLQGLFWVVVRVKKLMPQGWGFLATSI